MGSEVAGSDSVLKTKAHTCESRAILRGTRRGSMLFDNSMLRSAFTRRRSAGTTHSNASLATRVLVADLVLWAQQSIEHQRKWAARQRKRGPIRKLSTIGHNRHGHAQPKR